MLKANCRLESLLSEHKDEYAFPAGAAMEFEEVCTTMLLLQTQVAEHFIEEGVAYFDITSKSHMLQEIALMAKYINPRMVWAFLWGRYDEQNAASCTVLYPR